MAASSTENKTSLWSLKTMRNLHTFQAHKDVINANKFSFTKKSLITGSLDRTIKFWDLEKGVCSKTVRSLTLNLNQSICMSQLFDLNVSVSESFFATAHLDGSLKIWQLRTGETITDLKNAHEE